MVQNHANITKWVDLVQFLIKIEVRLLMMDAWMSFVLKAEMKMIKSAAILDFPLSIKLDA